MKKRPLGVKVFGLLFTFFGVAGLLIVLLFGTIASGMDRYYGQEPNMPRQISIVRSVIISLFSLGCGVGLFMLKTWARWLVLIGAGIGLLLACSGLVTLCLDALDAPYPAVFWSPIIFSVTSVAWNSTVLWYFLRPGVKAQFQKTTANL